MELDLRDLARKGLQSALAQLDAERARRSALLAELDGAPRPAATSPAPRRTRTMSPEGRQRIQEAVRRRWERERAARADAAATSPDLAGSEAPAPADAPASKRRRRATPPRSGGRKK